MTKYCIRLFTLVIGVSFLNFGHSQDTIQLLSGDQIIAKIISIDEFEMKYTKHINLEGPTYIMKLNKISVIKYKNGTSDIFNKINEVPTNQTKSSNTHLVDQNDITANPFNKSIGVNMAFLLLRQVELDYEYRFKNGKLAVGVPISFSLDPDFAYKYFEITNNLIGNDIYTHSQIWSAGVDLNIYVDRDIFLNTYYDSFFGFGVDFGQSNYVQTVSTFVPDSSIIGLVEIKEKNASREFYSISVILGAEIYPSEQLSFQIGGKLIGRNYIGKPTYNNGIETVDIGENFNLLIRPQLRIKYRF